MVPQVNNFQQITPDIQHCLQNISLKLSINSDGSFLFQSDCSKIESLSITSSLNLTQKWPDNLCISFERNVTVKSHIFPDFPTGGPRIWIWMGESSFSGPIQDVPIVVKGNTSLQIKGKIMCRPSPQRGGSKRLKLHFLKHIQIKQPCLQQSKISNGWIKPHFNIPIT